MYIIGGIIVLFVLRYLLANQGLMLQWVLFNTGLAKRCPHKRVWQATRATANGLTYYVCAGCLLGWNSHTKHLPKHLIEHDKEERGLLNVG